MVEVVVVEVLQVLSAVGAVGIVITDELGAMVVVMDSKGIDEATEFSTGSTGARITLLRRIDGVFSSILCQSVGRAQAWGLFEK